MNHSNLSEADRVLLQTKAEEYLEEAQAFKQQNKFQLTIDAAQQATALFFQLKMWEQCIKTRRLVGGILFNMGVKQSVLFAYLDETYQLALEHLDENHFLLVTIFRHYGIEHSRFGNLKTAIDYLYKALEIIKTIDGDESVRAGQLYGEIGQRLSFLGNYNKAVAAIEKGLFILEKAKQRFQLEHEKNTTKWEIEKNKALLLRHYGTVLSIILLHEDALIYLNRALAIYQDHGKLQDSEVINTYLVLGHAYAYIGEEELALLYYKKMLDLSRSVYFENHKSTVTAKNQIAQMLIATGAGEEAIPYLEEVVHVCENLAVVRKEHLSETYPLFVHYYRTKEKFDEAFLYAQKSLVLNTQIFGEISPDVAESEVLIAELYQHKKEYSKALHYFRQALDRCYKLGLAHYTVTSACLQGMGNIMAIQNKYRSALNFIQESIQNLCPGFEESDIYQNPNPKNISFHIDILHALLLKADVFFQYYQKETQEVRDYEVALSNYELVDALVRRLRQSYHLTQSKLNLSAQLATEIYGKGIYTAFHAPATKNQTKWAFEFSEKAKATVLYTSLQENIAKVSSNIPTPLLQKEKNLRIQLTALEKSMEQYEGESDLLQKLQNEFFDLHQAYIQLIEGFEQDYPDYYQLKYQTDTISIEEIQANLADNQWMVSYFIGENRYYIFLIGKDEFEVLDLEKISGFEALVEDFLSAIQNHKLEEYAQKGYELYQELLQPLEMYLIDPSIEETEAVQQLIIIPHGILHYLPFEALVCSRTKNSGKVYVVNEQEENTTNPYQSLDYALLHFEVSYHYSATLWHYLLKKQGERASKDVNNFVGFAPVYENTLLTNELEMGSENNEKVEIEKAWTLAANEMQAWASRSEALRGDGTWIPLPHSKTEAQNIAALFEEKGLPTQTFLHEQATKRQFREVVESSRFLLIAAHGVVNDKHPKLSGLVFYPPSQALSRFSTVDKVSTREVKTLSTVADLDNSWNSESTADCILSMEETYHLNLQADLVVLSSCESGIGTLAEGEGMMAVNRGFLYAGAKNVVSTLFKVYDEPSSFLTQYLFEGVLGGMNYAAALRQAKLRLLELERVDVKSWCGFVLIGT